jgi:hypothetical protein
MASPLRAENGRFLWRFADESQPFIGSKLLPLGRRHIVLALTLLERHDGYFFWLGELFYPPDERLGDWVHQRTAGQTIAQVEPEKTGHPSRPLQRRHGYVQVHSVDSFDLPRHVLPENLCDRP